MVKKEAIEKKDKLDKIPMSNSSQFPTMLISTSEEIAFDFATKVYKRFENIIKSIAYFGSGAKKDSTPESDVDIIVIIDDVSIKWDEELIATYREELGKIVQSNPYIKPVHVTTAKLSLWFQDAIRGDPIIVNILRSGYPLIDHGGFFLAFKKLLERGSIRPTPEAISALLDRSPQHLARARASMLGALDGLYWACVDSAHAALIAANIVPPSPEHVADCLENEFVKKSLLGSKEAAYFREIYLVAKEVIHGKRTDIGGKKLDEYFDNTNNFMRKMAEIIEKLTKQ